MVMEGFSIQARIGKSLLERCGRETFLEDFIIMGDDRAAKSKLNGKGDLPFLSHNNSSLHLCSMRGD